jgi:hypothetical protein
MKHEMQHKVAPDCTKYRPNMERLFCHMLTADTLSQLYCLTSSVNLADLPEMWLNVELRS